MKAIALYISLINLIAAATALYDKHLAINKQWRIAERTLFLVAILGGSAAMLITMKIVRHKTQHLRFMLGLPVILLLQVILVLYAYKRVMW